MSAKKKGATHTASAPGKTILFGEHFVVHGTGAILCAIDRRISITAARSQGVRIHSELGSLEYGSYDINTADVDRALRPLHYIAKEASKTAGWDGGITLHVRSDIPPGAGLGSSSACCVAGAAAALKALGVDADAGRVMDIAAGAERTIFPDASGADTAASALGGMITYNVRTGYRKVRPAAGTCPGFGLVVADSGLAHDTRSVVARVTRFRDQNPSRFDELCAREAQIVSRATSLLQAHDGGPSAGMAPELGRLASLNQEYLREVGASNDTLDEMTDAMGAATYGAKITGAGGGGCVIAFTSGTAAAESAAARLSEAGYDCFAARIDHAGLNTF